MKVSALEEVRMWTKRMFVLALLGGLLTGPSSGSLWGQERAATIVDDNSKSMRVTNVGVDVYAHGVWQFGPPHRTEKGIFVYIRGSDAGAQWEDRVQVKLSEVRSLTGSGWCRSARVDPSARLEVLMRDGRRLLLAPRKYTPEEKGPDGRIVKIPWIFWAYREITPDGTVEKDVAIDTWELEGGTFTDARGTTVTSGVDSITGRARNPLGRESDFSISICKVRTLEFE